MMNITTVAADYFNLSSTTQSNNSETTQPESLINQSDRLTAWWQKVSIILFSFLFVTSLYIFATLVINEHRSKRIVTKKGVKYLR